MSQFICNSCRTTLRQSLRLQRRHILSTRSNSSIPSSEPPVQWSRESVSQDPESDTRELVDIDKLLSKPSWSIQSLLPNKDTQPQNEITSAKLHHLLRLSALPPPKNAAEEEAMLKTLHTQLHFVKIIQQVDTEGVEPLQMIRDETEQGTKDITIGLEDLREALEKEDFKGRNKRPRRRREEAVEMREDKWDVFAAAQERVDMPLGRFFVVKAAAETAANPRGSKIAAKGSDVAELKLLEESDMAKPEMPDVQILRRDMPSIKATKEKTIIHTSGTTFIHYPGRNVKV